ncbi:hypothetical protein FACS1894166_07040 [Bacilli bacterium]|nr:hypothetical protein FACS1894166_07040 [Bacilli bacterium]
MPEETLTVKPDKYPANKIPDANSNHSIAFSTGAINEFGLGMSIIHKSPILKTVHVMNAPIKIPKNIFSSLEPTLLRIDAPLVNSPQISLAINAQTKMTATHSVNS